MYPALPNILEFKFTSSSDYQATKVILEFPISEYESIMWEDTSMSASGYRPLNNGDEIPCFTTSNSNADSSFKCIYEKG